jgi:5'-3' exonuclease
MNDSITFVDLSHYIFHRFFALQSWCRLAEKELTVEEFQEKYKTLFIKNLQSVIKKLNANWKKTYFARDCYRDTVWRRALFPEYKANRDDRQDSFDPTIFSYTYEHVMPELIAKYECKMIEYPCAEADDIVAVAHKKVRTGNKEIQINIITNDNDYLQLLDGKTRIVNCKMLDLSSRFSEEKLATIAHLKVIMGDKSDNIPSIQKKIGEKTAFQLCQNPDALQERLKDADCRTVYERNRKLIMFEEIPETIQQGIYQLLIHI